MPTTRKRSAPSPAKKVVPEPSKRPKRCAKTHKRLEPPPQDMDDVPCTVCGSNTDDERMLLCDGCDAGYHTYCLTPTLNKIPKGDWYCPECEAEANGIDDIPCKVCGSNADDENMLLCDGCDAGYHIHCLAPPLEKIPDGDWYCPECDTKGPAATVVKPSAEENGASPRNKEAPEETTTPAKTATPTGTCAPQQTEECHTRGAPKLEAAAEEKLEKPTQEEALEDTEFIPISSILALPPSPSRERQTLSRAEGQQDATAACLPVEVATASHNPAQHASPKSPPPQAAKAKAKAVLAPTAIQLDPSAEPSAVAEEMCTALTTWSVDGLKVFIKHIRELKCEHSQPKIAYYPPALVKVTGSQAVLAKDCCVLVRSALLLHKGVQAHPSPPQSEDAERSVESRFCSTRLATGDGSAPQQSKLVVAFHNAQAEYADMTERRAKARERSDEANHSVQRLPALTKRQLVDLITHVVDAHPEVVPTVAAALPPLDLAPVLAEARTNANTVQGAAACNRAVALEAPAQVAEEALDAREGTMAKPEGNDAPELTAEGKEEETGAEAATELLPVVELVDAVMAVMVKEKEEAEKDLPPVTIEAEINPPDAIWGYSGLDSHQPFWL